MKAEVAGVRQSMATVVSDTAGKLELARVCFFFRGKGWLSHTGGQCRVFLLLNMPVELVIMW